MLLTTSGPRRTVVSLDPATGKTLWTLPGARDAAPRVFDALESRQRRDLHAHQRPRRGLHHDAGLLPARARRENRQAARGLGRRGAGRGFPKSGSVDLLKDLIADWGPWLQTRSRSTTRPRACRSSSATSPPRRRRSSSTTCSSSATPRSRATTRRASRTCPATSSRTTRKSGKFMWKFHVIPRPGEFGHETWENDAWKWTGDVSSWAPMSADPARGLVYIPTNGATMDYFGGFRPGDNLFSTSVIALDVKTGKRVWHQQLVKHDIWNYDTPTAPILLDVNVERPAHSRPVPGDQAVVGLLVQPPHRRADLADGRPAGAAVEGAGREARRDAAARDQAGAVRSAGPQRRAPDRLHARDPEARARARAGARPAGAALRAADASRQRGRQGPGEHLSGRQRRREHHRSAGGRSDHRHHLHRVDERLLADDSRAGEGARQRQDDRQDAGAVGHRARREARRRRSRSRTIRWPAFPISSRDRLAASPRST